MMSLSKTEVEQILPHAYPFVMIDEVIELYPGKRGVGIKDITYDDIHINRGVAGNFFPPVLIIEACGQLTGLVSVRENTSGKKRGGRVMGGDDKSEKINYFAGIPWFKVLKPVRPGDRLILEAVIIKRLKDLVYSKVNVKTESELVAEGAVMVTCYQ